MRKGSKGARTRLRDVIMLYKHLAAELRRDRFGIPQAGALRGDRARNAAPAHHVPATPTAPRQ